MFKSSGYFKGVTCPYYASGLCERPYCHFRHVKPEEIRTTEYGVDNVAGKAAGDGQHSANESVFQKLESVKWYNPTPINKLQTRSHQTSSGRKRNNVPDYNPTPLHVLNSSDVTPSCKNAPPESSKPKIINSTLQKVEEKGEEKYFPSSDSESGTDVKRNKSSKFPNYKPTPICIPLSKKSENNKEDIVEPAVETKDKDVDGSSNDIAETAPKQEEARFSSDEENNPTRTLDNSKTEASIGQETEASIGQETEASIGQETAASIGQETAASIGQETEASIGQETAASVVDKDTSNTDSQVTSVEKETSDTVQVLTETTSQSAEVKSEPEVAKDVAIAKSDSNKTKTTPPDVIVIDSDNEKDGSFKHSSSKSRRKSSGKSKKHKSSSHHKSSKSHSKDKKSTKKSRSSSHKSSDRSNKSTKRKKHKHESRRSRNASSSSESSSSASDPSAVSLKRKSRSSKRRHSSSSSRHKKHHHSSSKSSRRHRSRSSKAKSRSKKHRRHMRSSTSSSSSTSSASSRESRSRVKVSKTSVTEYVTALRGDVKKGGTTTAAAPKEQQQNNNDKNIFESLGSTLAQIKSEPKSSEKKVETGIKTSKPAYTKSVSSAALFGDDSDSETKSPSAKDSSQPVSDNQVSSTQVDKVHKNSTNEIAKKPVKTLKDAAKKTVKNCKNVKDCKTVKEAADSDSESVVLSASDNDGGGSCAGEADHDLDKSLELSDSVLADLEQEMSEEDPFDECYQIYQNSKMEEKNNQIKAAKASVSSQAEKDQVEEAAPAGKVRVARTATGTSAYKSSLQKRLENSRSGAHPSPAQVLHNRLAQAQQQAERKRSTAEQPSLSYFGIKRARLAHGPRASADSTTTTTAGSGEKAGATQSTSCGSLSKFGAPGSKREAHVPKKKVSLPRPTVPVEYGSKIPANVRQVYLNKIIDECLKIYPEQADAYDRALSEEKEVYERGISKKIYLNVAVNCIKKLRTEAGQLQSSPAADVHPKQMSHEMLLGGAKALKTHFTVKRSSHAGGTQELTESEFYARLKAYILTSEQQWDNGYPRPDPDNSRQALICLDDEKLKNRLCDSKDERLCVRCGKRFRIDATSGEYTSTDSCIFHWGKAFKRRITKGVFESKWTCCGGESGAKGCHVAASHVHEQNKYEDRKGFVRMLAASARPSDGNYGVYALDCEMVYTTVGQEIARVTVVDFKGESVLEQLILPGHPVLDYNTRFSGITENDMQNVGISLRDVQAMMMGLFNRKTILIGHSLESDLIALKMIHDTVVDTSVVFPHRLGPPYKRALKTLMADILQRIIQEDVGGHDSLEDAVSAMDLMKWKVKDDMKKDTIRVRVS